MEGSSPPVMNHPRFVKELVSSSQTILGSPCLIDTEKDPRVTAPAAELRQQI
jgi:hypothetical protein